MSFKPFQIFRVDYSLVGRRDGLAAREPDPSLWRKNDYRRGYAEGLIAAAKRIAQVQSLSNSPKQSVDAVLRSRENRT